MNTTHIQKLAATLTLTLGALAPTACTRGADMTSVDSTEPGASAQASEKTQAIALSIEQAERKLDVGRDIPAAKAALEEVLRDPSATPDQRDLAKLGLSRALEAAGDREGATRAVEALLAEHGDKEHGRWSQQAAAEKRLRKLVTGSDAEPKRARRDDWRQASSFAHALTPYFPKAEAGKEISVKIFAFGGEPEMSDKLGTFDVSRALREDRRQACPLCDEQLSIHTSTERSGGWVSIPMYRPRLGEALAVYYFDLGAGRIPARYDAELPIPSAEIVSHLERGHGLVATRERPGAPPVILIAAPRRAQLAAVEESLAKKKVLPSAPEEVPLVAHLEASEIQEVVRGEGFPGFRVCYEALLKQNPTASGKVGLKFAIQPNGTVSDLAIGPDATLTDATFQQCALGVLGALVFPSAPEKTTITYPMEFTPGD